MPARTCDAASATKDLSTDGRQPAGRRAAAGAGRPARSRRRPPPSNHHLARAGPASSSPTDSCPQTACVDVRCLPGGQPRVRASGCFLTSSCRSSSGLERRADMGSGTPARLRPLPSPRRPLDAQQLGHEIKKLQDAYAKSERQRLAFERQKTGCVRDVVLVQQPQRPPPPSSPACSCELPILPFEPQSTNRGLTSACPLRPSPGC